MLWKPYLREELSKICNGEKTGKIKVTKSNDEDESTWPGTQEEETVWIGDPYWKYISESWLWSMFTIFNVHVMSL